MDSKELHNLHEAYLDVYDEGYKSFPYEKVIAKEKKIMTDRASLGKKPLTGKSESEISDTLNKLEKSRNRATSLSLQTSTAHSEAPKRKEKSNRNRPESEKRSKTVEPQKSFGNRLTRSDRQGIRDSYEYDLYDIILSHLIAEGYAETEGAAESIMTNMSEEWRDEILSEAITSEKGKAKAAEMIAARTTASGRAKSGKGANVAQIRQIRGSGRGDFDREGLGGTPMTPTMAKNPIKKQNYTGTGNKAARRAGTYKESFNIFVNSMIAEGVSMERYTWEEIQNVFDDLFEAQVANRNPDEYERKAKQGQSREQQLKGRVMGRMNQMDPDKKAAMLKQMRAAGLDV